MQVPGDVTSALVDAGVIEEPFLKTNTKKNLWIRDLSWWLVKDFEVSEAVLEEDIVRLNIEMLDFNADILLNGMRVAHHENAFCAFSEDVKRFLQAGENRLRERQRAVRPARLHPQAAVHLRLGLVPARAYLRHRPQHRH